MKNSNFLNRKHTKICLTFFTALLSINGQLNAQTKDSYAINVGGNSFQASDGTQYTGDGFYSNGRTYYSSADINDTLDDTLYRSERWGEFSYNLPIQNGTYDVTLKLSENWAQNVGQRKFNVKAEGVEIGQEIDILAEAGRFKALDRTYQISVTDGTLNLDFLKGSANNPKLGALLIKKIASDDTPQTVDPAGDLTAEVTEITAQANIDAKSVYLAAYEEKVLVSWNATSSPQRYGVVSQIDVSSESNFKLDHEYDFSEQCESVGGVTASADGSRIAVLCLGRTNTYKHADDRSGHKVTARPSGLENFFPSSKFYNLLAQTGPWGFYYGDTFTFTEGGKDLFVLEFTSGLDDTPDNVIFVNSATFAGQYGHLNISINPAIDGLYHISSKVRSNRDAKGLYHTGTKQFGLKNRGDGTYNRLRLSNNYGTNFGTTHNDLADVSYNKALKKWGMMAWGDHKVAWSTVPDRFEGRSKKGSTNTFNKSEFVLLNGLTERQATAIISLEEQGFMGLAEYNGNIGLKKFPATVPALEDHQWTTLNIQDRGFANLSNYSIDADNIDASNFLLGWSPEENVFYVQTVNADMELLGSPTLLPVNSGWQENGQWALSSSNSKVSFIKVSGENKFQLTVIEKPTN